MSSSTTTATMLTTMMSSTVEATTHHGDPGATGPTICAHVELAPTAVLFIFFSLCLGVIMRQLIGILKLNIPYTVCLLLLGIAWAAITDAGFADLGEAACIVSEIDPGLLLLIFLPMLIFESAFSLNWHAFKGVLVPALILAVPGLLFSIFVTGAVVHDVILPGEYDWNSSLLLATILSATDPVAVVALLREQGGPPALATLIESESLLNDGTAIVAFEILIELAAGIHLTGAEGVETAFRLSFGGPALGLLWGVVTIWWIGRIIDDDLSEVTVTLLSAYLLFYVAEDVCHVSAVLALVVLGACFAAYGKTRISPKSEHSTHTFWSILTYHGNTLIFVFVGVVLYLQNDFTHIEGRDWGFVFVLWVFLYLIRGAMVMVFSLPIRWAGYPMKWSDGFVVAHGGLRGAVSLALALSVSLGGGSEGGHGELPEVVQVKTLFYVGGIALLTLIINASTTSFVLKKLGLVKEKAAQKIVYETAKAKIERSTRKTISAMAQDEFFSMVNWEQLYNFLSLKDQGEIDFENPKVSKMKRPSQALLDDEAIRAALEQTSVLHEPPADVNLTSLTDSETDDEDAMARSTDRKMQALFSNREDGARTLGRLRSVANRSPTKAQLAEISSSSPTPDACATGESSFSSSDSLHSHCALELNNLDKIHSNNKKGRKQKQRRFDSVKYGEEDERSVASISPGPQSRADQLLGKRFKRRASTYQAQQLQSARITLLISTRAFYNELFENGFLSRRVVQLLIDSSEAEEELTKKDSTYELHDWSVELVRFTRTPWYLRLLKSMNWFCFDALRLRIIRHYSLHHAADVVNIADAFIAAHRKILADISGAIKEVAETDENVSQLVAESSKNIKLARLVIRKLPDDIVSAVRTRQAAGLLVTKQESLINDLRKEGVLTMIEHENLLAHVRELRRKLLFNKVKFTFPNPSCVLQYSRLFHSLSPNASRDVANSIEIAYMKRGEFVVRAKEHTSGIYIVLRGFVSVTIPSMPDKDGKGGHTGSVSHLGAGGMLSIIETVSGHPGVLSCVVTSDVVELAFISNAQCQRLRQQHPSFTQTIYRVAGYHLLGQKRRELFTAAGRVFPPARNIAHAPFGIREELWPFAANGVMEELSKGQHIVVGVAGIVVRGEFRGIKHSKKKSKKARNVHHIASIVFDSSTPKLSLQEKAKPSRGATVKRGGLPSFKQGGVLQTNAVNIPLNGNCEGDIADVSETISDAIQQEHIQGGVASVNKANVKFDDKVYRQFMVVKAGEYICSEPGLLFIIGPTTVQNTDIFSGEALSGSETEEDNHTSNGSGSSEDSDGDDYDDADDDDDNAGIDNDVGLEFDATEHGEGRDHRGQKKGKRHSKESPRVVNFTAARVANSEDTKGPTSEAQAPAPRTITFIDGHSVGNGEVEVFTL